MMSTTPQLPVHDLSAQRFPTPAPMPANGIGSSEVPTTEGDDRSSSLSDIEDRTANTEIGPASRAIRGGSEANDTEAETERLEDSPQKGRKHTNVVLRTSNDIYQESANVVENDVLPVSDVPDRPELLIAPNERDSVRETSMITTRMDQTSEISSLEDFSEENERSVPSSNMPSKKRKRKTPQSNSLSEDEKTAKVLITKNHLHPGQTSLHSSVAGKGSGAGIFFSDNDKNSGAHKREYTESGLEATSSQHLSLSKSKSKKGKRKVKKTKDEDLEHTLVAIAYADSQTEHFESIEHVDSNGEDAEMEDIGEGAEAEVAAKTEEGLMNKKSAMSSLSAIENCFATLRDKLFDERLFQYNDELAVLSQPLPTHPEYLAQKDVIDRYRDEKIDYEETLFRYKLIALQRKSIAEKAQIHSQYMQTVREIRDRNLEQLNKEWYQIQRERRSCEDNMPDYMYKFCTRRSQQIRQQTAYNTEVSILSGVAKYVGFPAAPDIVGARPSEVDDDFAAMAAAIGHMHTQASHSVQKQSSSLRANSSSATAGFPRQKPAVEERFLEQNPWANPQHPAHHQHHHSVQRQLSNVSRPASPFSTPVGQRRIVDLPIAQGSASTIAEPRSRPSSSIAPTPVAGERTAKFGRLHQPFPADSTSSSTPSRIVETPIKALVPGLIAPDVPNEKVKAIQSGIVGRSDALSSLDSPGQNIAKVPNDPSKPLSLKESMAFSSPFNMAVSPQSQYPVIKAEHASQPSHGSPALNHYDSPNPPRISSNGHSERFGVL